MTLFPATNTHKSRIKRALKAAKLSDARQRHGAVIYKGGSLISIGVNVVKNDPYFCGDACKNPNNHAETMAIRACGPDFDFSNAILYVARVNRSGKPLNSKPCATCEEAIEASGIKKVYHT